jgi:hypothetical protein
VIEAPNIENLLTQFRRDAEAYTAASENSEIRSALIWDACDRHGLLLTVAMIEEMRDRSEESLLQALACAVLFRLPVQPDASSSLQEIFDRTLPALAKISSTKTSRWLVESEGNEELIRLVIRDLKLSISGETEAFSRDRLQSISLFERQRLLAISRDAEKRAKEIRRALAAKAAKEAADKYGRE